MRIHEFRIPLNMHVDEFQIAQLYMTIHASDSETGNGEGIEVLCNEPYDNTDGQLGRSKYSGIAIPKTKGQYTLKHYHFASRLPSYLSAVCPAESMILIEEAWNAYPHCVTVLTNCYLSEEKFFISIELESQWKMD